MAVYKTSDGRWVASYGGEKVYTTSQSKAMSAYDTLKSGTSTSSSTSTKTSSGSTSSGSTSSGSTSPSYVTFQTSSGPAYFQQTSSGLSAVNDPNILKQLQSGAIGTTSTTVDQALASTKASGGTASNVFSSSVATPSLTKTTAPTSLGEMTAPAPTYTAPELNSPIGDITNAVAGMDGYSSLIDANRKFYEQQMALQQKQAEESKSSFEKMLASITSPKEARTQAWQETGIDVQEHFAKQEAGVKEIESLTNEYNKVVAMKDQQIAQTNDKMASMNFINNQTAQIERNAAPVLNRISADINAKAAALQAQQGNFAEAQRYVNQAVQDATAEAKFQYDMYATMYEMNQDNFGRMNSIYTNAFNSTMAIAEAEYNRQYAEKQQIGELLLQYPTSGIDIYNDSFEDAIQKVSTVAPVSAPSGLSGISSRTRQVLDGFITLDKLTPSEAAKVRDELYDLSFGSATSPDWFTQSTVEQILGQPITQQLLEDYFKVNFAPDVIELNMKKFTDRLMNEVWTQYKNQVMTTSGGGTADLYDSL